LGGSIRGGRLEALAKGFKGKGSQERGREEIGAPRKDPGGRVGVALVWPGNYATGMSSLGFLSIYGLINSKREALCERFFIPEQGGAGSRFLSIENHRPLQDFHIIAGSLSLENDYHLFLKALSLGGLSPMREERLGGYYEGIVIAGGVGPWSNPYPLLPFVDLILTGEGEISWKLILELYGRADFLALNKKEKIETLEKLTPGALAPGVMEGELLDDRDPVAFGKALSSRSRVIPPRMGFPPGEEELIPRSPIFSKGAEFSGMRLVEISRGCPYGCRFCLAGSLYRPHRFWSKERILDGLREPFPWQKESPFPEDSPVGLVSPSVADHPELSLILEELLKEKRRVSFSSIRLSALDERMVKLFSEGKLLGLAIAPEGGTQRMRASMNKNITEDEILYSAELLSKVNLKRLKLYFMLGLPGERDEDVRGIADLTMKIKERSMGKSRAPLISVTVSNFSPKPHTPFEDAPLLSLAELKRRGELLLKLLGRSKGVELKLDPPLFSIIQGLLGRAGPEGGRLVKALYENEGRAKAALKSLEAWDYEEKAREFLKERPWRIIAAPEGDSFLENEKRKSLREEFTDKCPEALSCGRCEACGTLGGKDR
jgi:radical SAM superfamily enzyme YgiQ (UPF0313 family)